MKRSFLASFAAILSAVFLLASCEGPAISAKEAYEKLQNIEGFLTEKKEKGEKLDVMRFTSITTRNEVDDVTVREQQIFEQTTPYLYEMKVTEYPSKKVLEMTDKKKQLTQTVFEEWSFIAEGQFIVARHEAFLDGTEQKTYVSFPHSGGKSWQALVERVLNGLWHQTEDDIDICRKIIDHEDSQDDLALPYARKKKFASSNDYSVHCEGMAVKDEKIRDVPDAYSISIENCLPAFHQVRTSTTESVETIWNYKKADVSLPDYSHWEKDDSVLES